MVEELKTKVPTLGDNVVAYQLSKAGINTEQALKELKTAADKVYLKNQIKELNNV